MVKIELTKGYTAIVDDCDGDLSEFNWCASVKGNGRRVYAVRRPNCKMTYLHRVILERMLGHAIPADAETDHRDGNTLDNRRENLRLATKSQNKANSRKRSGTTSRFRGIARNGSGWMATIGLVNAEYLGTFRTEEDAARAYNKAALARWGEFAKLNDV